MWFSVGWHITIHLSQFQWRVTISLLSNSDRRWYEPELHLFYFAKHSASERCCIHVVAICDITKFSYVRLINHTVYLTSTLHKDGQYDLIASLYLIVITVCHDGVPWWRHQMETFSALLAICVGNSPVTDEFPVQKPVTRSFGVFLWSRPE